jgi:hypothetical protein
MRKECRVQRRHPVTCVLCVSSVFVAEFVFWLLEYAAWSCTWVGRGASRVSGRRSNYSSIEVAAFQNRVGRFHLKENGSPVLLTLDGR